MRHPWLCSFVGLIGWLILLGESMSAGEPAKSERNITYATADRQPLRLDMYLPEGAARPPLIIWVHGGAWRAGSKDEMPLQLLVKQGYAVASVDYRLSTTARFPAQIHDIKAAIRFLRAKHEQYGYDPNRFVLAGNSAGGHLAVLAGVARGDLEGDLGEHPDTPADVQAIICFYGMSNLTTILAQSTPHGLKVRVPALDLLLGGQPDAVPDLARLASPVFHVDERSPPLLLLHGDQDPQAPINQAHELVGRYATAKRPCEFLVLHGSKHGGPEFFDRERCAQVHAFLQQHLPGSAD